MITGLSDEEAARRLSQFGYNELPTDTSNHTLKMLFSVVKEPMVIFLLACGLIYLILGDAKEAIPLFASIVFVVALAFFQKRKTERALSSLRRLSSPRAMVLRAGEKKRIPGREVVPGDIVFIKEGDRIPSDGILLSGENLQIDESILTGEAFAVDKRVEEGMLYSSTLVVRGSGMMESRHTGQNTEVGKIGRSLATIESGATILQFEIAQITKYVAVTAAVVCLLIFVVYSSLNDDWLRGLLIGLTAAMSLIPEEFVVILSVFLALGAWRMSKNRALVRFIPAIEALGSVSVLCVDKTGTITMNQMSIGQLCNEAGNFISTDQSDLPEEFHSVTEYAVLASQKDPFDPMEKAIKEFCYSKLNNTEHVHPDWDLVKEYPLTPELLAMSCVWKSKTDMHYLIASKGAPEAIFDLCHLPPEVKSRNQNLIREMAGSGLRVLGVARAIFSPPDLPAQQHDFDFRFLGLVGLQDPVRPGVPEAIRECKNAGIQIVMITGDYPETAQNIAKKIGIPHSKVITGATLDDVSEQEITQTHLFARISPNQKLQIVKAFKNQGHTVAMTGDGVNDGPSLKAADVGIAMGKRGTDVAREASDIVLLDDDFTTIVKAVKQGRRIFDNLKKAVSYVLAIHVPIAGMSLIPVLLKLPLVLLPIHIVFLELIIDPACSLAFESEPAEPDIMSRKPRAPYSRVFDRKLILQSLWQGSIALFFVAAVYGLALYLGRSENEARTYSFIVLIFSNLAFMASGRWRIFFQPMSHNPVLITIFLIGTVFVSVSVYAPYVRDFFMFASIPIMEFAICSLIGFLSVFKQSFLRFALHTFRSKFLAHDSF